MAHPGAKIVPVTHSERLIRARYFARASVPVSASVSASVSESLTESESMSVSMVVSVSARVIATETLSEPGSVGEMYNSDKFGTRGIEGGNVCIEVGTREGAVAVEVAVDDLYC